MDRKRNNFNKNPGYRYNIQETDARIKTPLHKHYTNPVELYLPNGIAYKYAEQFKNIPNHQMRKILDGVKEALLIGDSSFEDAKKKMFVLVAMSAYNAGRLGKNVKLLYAFIKDNINEYSILSLEDIKTFDQLFTSIVAYHKELGR